LIKSSGIYDASRLAKINTEEALRAMAVAVAGLRTQKGDIPEINPNDFALDLIGQGNDTDAFVLTVNGQDGKKYMLPIVLKIMLEAVHATTQAAYETFVDIGPRDTYVGQGFVIQPYTPILRETLTQELTAPGLKQYARLATQLYGQLLESTKGQIGLSNKKVREGSSILDNVGIVKNERGEFIFVVPDKGSLTNRSGRGGDIMSKRHFREALKREIEEYFHIQKPIMPTETVVSEQLVTTTADEEIASAASQPRNDAAAVGEPDAEAKAAARGRVQRIRQRKAAKAMPELGEAPEKAGAVGAQDTLTATAGVEMASTKMPNVATVTAGSTGKEEILGRVLDSGALNLAATRILEQGLIRTPADSQEEVTACLAGAVEAGLRPIPGSALYEFDPAAFYGRLKAFINSDAFEPLKRALIPLIRAINDALKSQLQPVHGIKNIAGRINEALYPNAPFVIDEAAQEKLDGSVIVLPAELIRNYGWEMTAVSQLPENCKVFVTGLSRGERGLVTELAGSKVQFANDYKAAKAQAPEAANVIAVFAETGINIFGMDAKIIKYEEPKQDEFISISELFRQIGRLEPAQAMVTINANVPGVSKLEIVKFREAFETARQVAASV